MNITTLIQYLMFIIESFIFWRVISGALEPKYTLRVTVAAAAVMFAILSAKKIVFGLPGLEEYMAIGTIILISYSFIGIMFLCRNPFFEKLIWMFVYILGSAIMEILPILFLNLVLDKTIHQNALDHISFFFLVVFKFMNLLLIEAIIRRRKGSLLIGTAYYRELVIIVFFNLVLLVGAVYIFTNEKNVLMNIDEVVFYIFGIVFLITLYIIILIFRLEKKSKEEIDNQLKLQQIEMELKLNDDMLEVTEKLRKLRHDMNNHLGLIKVLSHTKKYEELDEYINQIYEDVELANELVITNNMTVSVLLNTKISLAKSKNIDFNSLITVNEFKLQNKDICALLGNILDNAIEAAEGAEGKRYIDLMLQKIEQGYKLSCENSIGKNPVLRRNNFVTTKENTLLHGIGIKNIRDIVNKYHGEISFDYDDEVFRVNIVIPE